jgi:DNA polymerase III sliding clamp (beta) subunit (PCNA family)
VNILFDPERLYLQTMDKSNISVCELVLPKKWFDEYMLGKQSETIGVNTTILYKILSTRDKQIQRIIVSYEEDNSDVLSVAFVSPPPNDVIPIVVEEPVKKGKGKKKQEKVQEEKPQEKVQEKREEMSVCSDRKNVFDKEFELPLYGIDTELFQIPPQEYDAEVVIDSGTLFAPISQLKNFGDTVEMRFTEDKIVMRAHSIESGKMDVIIDINDVESYEIVENANISMSFSLNYLYNICAFYEVSKNIKISVLENFPVKLSYDLSDDGFMQFFLAPKENDDD